MRRSPNCNMQDADNRYDDDDDDQHGGGRERARRGGSLYDNRSTDLSVPINWPTKTSSCIRITTEGRVMGGLDENEICRRDGGLDGKDAGRRMRSGGRAIIIGLS